MEDEEEGLSGSEVSVHGPSDNDSQDDSQTDGNRGEVDEVDTSPPEIKEMKSSPNTTPQPPPADLSTTVEKTRVEERKKGIAVSHQMV